MSESEHREKPLNYSRLRADREVIKIFMWLKLGTGAVGFCIVIGYFWLSSAEISGGSGGYIFVSFILLMILILGLRDVVTLGLAKHSERKIHKK